jgi:hypothetical protein
MGRSTRPLTRFKAVALKATGYSGMMGSDEDTSMRLPTFNGQDAKWHMWKSKFLAYTCYKNFQGILNNDEIPRGEKDLKGDMIVLSDADKRHIGRRNTVAYASLIMA